MKTITSTSKFFIYIFLVINFITQIIAQQCIQLAGTCSACAVNSWSVGNAACTSCVSSAISSCSSSTGLATSCYPGYGLSTAGTCSLCVQGTYSTGVSPCALCVSPLCSSMTGNIVVPTSTGCTTPNAVSCDAGNLGNVIQCATGFMATGNLCATIHARFTGSDWQNGAGNTVMVAGTSESNCVSNCATAVAGYWATTWVANSTTCLCRSLGTAGLSALTLTQSTGWSVNFVGMCSNYTGLNPSFSNTAVTTCQNVYYSTIGCLGADGSQCTSLPTVGCASIYTLTCDPVTHLATQCYPGYGLANNTCVACVSNTWSNGTLPCSLCTGSNSTACSPLTGLTTACVSGYAVVSGVCTAITGSVVAGCRDLNAASCDALTQGISETCNSGYGLISSPQICAGCTSGFFSPAGSNTTCSPCPSGQFSGALAGNCTNCLPNLGSATCGPFTNIVKTCHAGFGLVNGSCQTCIAGYFSPEGSNSTCTSCLPGSFAPSGSSICTLCPIGYIASTASSTACTQCQSPASSPAGGTLCSICSSGTYLASNATCLTCMTSPGIGSCGPLLSTAGSCHAGYGLVAGACQLCASGYASPEGSTSACSICPAGSFAAAGSASCTPCAFGSSSIAAGSTSCSLCVVGSSSVSGSTSCAPVICPTGYGLIGSFCVGCSAGTFSSGGINSTCSTCSQGQYSGGLAPGCTSCMTAGVGTCGPLSSTANTCLTGYKLVGTMCIACNNGICCNAGFKLVQSVCTPCGVNTFNNGSANVCIPGLDVYSATCDSTTGATLTCVQYYSLGNNSACQPTTLARFSSGRFGCANVGLTSGIASETACMAWCAVRNGISGPLLGIEYQASTLNCWCMGSACQAPALAPLVANGVITSVAGWVTSLVGTCSTYPNMGNFNCSIITYCPTGSGPSSLGLCAPCAVNTFSNGGVNACVANLDAYGATCDSTTGATLTCVQYYSLGNNSACQPTTLARFSSGRFGCANVGLTSGIASETACMAWCAVRNGISGPLLGIEYQASTLNCWCMGSACQAPALAPLVANGVITSVAGWVTSLVGTCSTYPNMGNFNCSIITYCPTGSGPSSLGLCTPCAVNTFSNGGANACVPGLDTYSATCDSTNGTALSCVQNYALGANNACEPAILARFVSGRFGCANVGLTSGIASETACMGWCTARNGISGPLLGIEYQASTLNCWCMGAACQAPALAPLVANGLITSVPGWVTSLVGACSSYPNMASFTCSAVSYCPPGSGPSSLGVCAPCVNNTFSGGMYACVTSTDLYSTTCDPINGTALTCVQNYALGANNACQPAILARFVSGRFGCANVGLTSGIASETACMGWCTARNGISGPLLGIEYQASTLNCWCMGAACQAPALAPLVANGLITSVPGWVTSLVGTCSNYPNMASFTCQTVNLSISGCVTTDGSGPCK